MTTQCNATKLTFHQRFPLRVRSSGESAELSGAECEGQCLPSGLGRMQRAAMSIP